MFARTVVTLLFAITLISSGENKLTNTFTFSGKIEVGKKEFVQRWAKGGIIQGPRMQDLILLVEQESVDKCHVILFGSDDCDHDEIPLNMFTMGNRTWEESLTLKAPPEEATAFCSVPIFGKESCGKAFWVKTSCDDYVLCRISSVYPENFSTLKVGEYVNMMIEWVDAANDKSLESLLPEGWRFPTEKDLGLDESGLKERKYMLDSIREPLYHVGADFNGDCVLDHACFLVNNNNTMNSIVILLSNDGGNYSIYKYSESKYPLGSSSYLSYSAPGKRKSFHETNPIFIRNHAFSVNYFESASALIYFDSQTKKFVSWQASD